MRDSEDGRNKSTTDEIEERQSEATSDETVSDISDVESPGNEGVRPESGRDSDAAPSPDGSIDQPDELKRADPM